MTLVSGIVTKFRYIATPLLPALWVPLVYTIFSSLDLITSFWEWGDRLLDEKDKLPDIEEVFDFIIVGAGSAGCAVAYRLSQDYSVLLIEAGGEPNPLQFIPALGAFLTGLDALDWKHKSVPQKYGSLNSINAESSWSVGRGLGGTGNLNYMIHLRGHTKDFDNWAHLTGDPSWSYEGVLPYFKRLEDHEGGDPRYHGFGGPLRIEKPDYVGLAPEYVRAGAELGYPSVDLNAPFAEGFDTIRYPIKYGVRQAPFQGYLKPIRNRKTLTIRKFSLATRILFKEGNVAYGVEYLRHQERRVAYAMKEVILSAGAITSPKLLMLSGIGPADHLNSLGIPVRQDLPVGKYLQDHLAVFQGPFFINQPRTVFIDRDLTPSAFVQWFTGGRGILSSPGSTAVGIVSSSFAKARGEGNWPDQLLYLFGLSVTRNYGQIFANAFSVKLDELNDYFRHAIGRDSFVLAISAARPLSKGYIKLGGTNINDKLIIDPNYFGDPDNIDLKVTVEALKKALFMMENTTTFGEELGCRFTEERYPACRHVPFRSDEYWECYARQYSITLHHPVGTCGMGRVVDTQLRVYGTQRLRVIDASIQPEIVTTNTQASALMIGEKGADIVLNFWRQKEVHENNLVKDYSGEYSHNHFYIVPLTSSGNSSFATSSF